MGKKKSDKPKKERFTTSDSLKVAIPADAGPNPVGRPTDYTLEIATRICDEIATNAESYRVICLRNPDFPDKGTMRRWRIKHEEFRTQYDQAKREQADLFIEELLDIADDGHNDWMLREYKDHEAWVINGEAMARSRLRIDTRKWIACKLLPKVYGGNPSPDEDKPFTDEERMQLHQLITRLVAKHEREY